MIDNQGETAPSENVPWEEREKRLLEQIKEYEQKEAANQQKIAALETQLKVYKRDSKIKL